jgi:hypothetical protein
MRTEVGKDRDRLKRENARLRERIHKMESPDEVRRDTEHWYEVVEYFDADAIQKLPVDGGSAFIMGKLDEVNIVEVGKGTPMDAIKRLGEWLKENGIDALLVSEGVKFMKLRPATDTQSEKLDRYEQTRRDAESEADKPPLPEGPPEPKHIPEEFEGRA